MTPQKRGPRCANGEDSDEQSFEALSHGFRTRCLRFAAWVIPGPRKTRYRLVVDLYRAGLATRWAPM